MYSFLDYKYKHNSRIDNIYNPYQLTHSQKLNTNYSPIDNIYLTSYGAKQWDNSIHYTPYAKEGYAIIGAGKDPVEAYIPPRSNYSCITLDSIKYVINARAVSLVWYLSNNPLFRAFSKNWDMLNKNLTKNLILPLDTDDKDVGFTIGKNIETKVKVYNGTRIVPLSILTHVVVHEMCHMSVSYSDHPPEFFELLSVMVLASSQLRFFDPSQIPSDYFEIYGQKTISKASIKIEIIKGINFLIYSTKDLTESELSYLRDWEKYVSEYY